MVDEYKITQRVASNSEESASSSEELSSQAGKMRSVVGDLAKLVGGNDMDRHNNHAAAHTPLVGVRNSASPRLQSPTHAASATRSQQQAIKAIPFDENEGSFEDF